MSKLHKCTICSKKKQTHEFYLRANGSVGEYKCKLCLSEKRKDKYVNDYENVRRINRKAVSEYQKRNKDINAAKTALYNSRKNNRTPTWLSKDDISKIKSIYKMCRAISKKTEVPHQVDHIVPLNGELVSGLHVPWNLQILPKSDNLSKSNKLIEDMIYS